MSILALKTLIGETAANLPEFDLPSLVNTGGTVGILGAAVWYIARCLQKQYEARIVSLEKESEICRVDRAELHRRIEDILTKGIGI